MPKCLGIIAYLWLHNFSHLIPSSSLKKALNPFNLEIYKILRSGDEYDFLIQLLKDKGTMNQPGDLVEIGSSIGVGTLRLARYAKKFGKKVYAIDIFDANHDKTENTTGINMSDIYSNFLNMLQMDQSEAYQYMIKGTSNVVTISKDSIKVRFAPDKKIAFGYIDGNHASEYVVNDFYLIWDNLVSRGIVAFDDYLGDIPQVTRSVDLLLDKHREEIIETFIVPPRVLAIVRR